MIKKISSLLLTGVITIGLVGCGVFSPDVTSYPLVDRMTEQDILDFYAEGLKYDSVITRNVDVQETSYVEKEVKGDKKELLEQLQSEVEAVLGGEVYEDSDLVTEDAYHYIKSYLNSYSLSDGKISSVTGALGYYFVDVEYNLAESNIGYMKPSVNLLGINGAFTKNAYNEDIIDSVFLSSAVNKLNSYYAENKIDRTASFDAGSNSFTTSSKDEDLNYNMTTSVDRVCSIDINTFNKVVGSSYKSLAYTPELSLVYEMPSASGDINGIGMYPSGENGLSLFDFDRSDIKGKCTLRYVFKDTVDGSGSTVGVNVYPKSESMTTGVNISDSNVKIPDFLYSEFEQLLERADRATMSNIIASLINGTIYEDMGYALLRGYEYNHVNLIKHMSTIRQVMARDTENNAYLLEIESTRIEGAVDVDSYGTYRDKSYVVIQQKGNEFVITDQIRVSRQVVSEPPINPDSSVEKRLVALNLSGDVSKDNQKSIEKLIDNWYKAGTARVLDTSAGAKEVKVNGEKVKIEVGMYNCFNDDVTMLSSADKETMNAKVRSLLTRFGTNVSCEYVGTITQWIGGYENQAEFTTEELFKYNRKDEAVYQEVYYLVSNMDGKWVIDERTVITEKTVSGSDADDIYTRIGN